MSEVFDRLRKKYGESAVRHEPLPHCKRCHGEGEYFVKSTGVFSDQYTFCACVFFDQEDLWIADELGKTSQAAKLEHRHYTKGIRDALAPIINQIAEGKLTDLDAIQEALERIWLTL